MLSFLNDDTREARRWLGPISDPAVREFLSWKDANTPYQGAKAKKLIEALRAEAKKAVESTAAARAHLGVDRGFYAKDEKTLVIEVPGPSPWLPSLLARGPLVALRSGWVEKKRENAFRQNAVFCNGPFLADCDLTRKMSGDNEKNLFKLLYYKNPNHWNAAAIRIDRITCVVNEVWDEVLRQYDSGQLQWLSSTAFASDDFARLLESKGAAFKPKDPVKDKEGARKDAALQKIAGESYEAAGGGVCFVRFRCMPPFDTVATRKAVAALIRPDALAKMWGESLGTTTRRFVQPRVAGGQATIRLPTFDPAQSKALYGAKRRIDDGWITILADTAEAGVAEGIAKAVKTPVLADDATTWIGMNDDVRRKVDSGSWNLAVSVWQPGFDDPLALLSAFTSRNAVGATMWSHPKFDALIAAAVDVAGFAAAPNPDLKDVTAVKDALAGASKDAAGLESLRRVLLAEAESLLLEEAVVVPLFTTVERGVAKPALRGLPVSARARSVLDVTPLWSLSIDG